MSPGNPRPPRCTSEDGSWSHELQNTSICAISQLATPYRSERMNAPDQWLKILLPFAFLLAKSFLPFTVRFLDKNPCLFFLFRCEGWYSVPNVLCRTCCCPGGVKTDADAADSETSDEMEGRKRVEADGAKERARADKELLVVMVGVRDIVRGATAGREAFRRETRRRLRGMRGMARSASGRMNSGAGRVEVQSERSSRANSGTRRFRSSPCTLPQGHTWATLSDCP